ncbi:putative membrane protein [Marmoricola bigeumensis]|uniref:Membrane protein n=1 Tax=Nocardioides marmoribigeumensis TaxID=433649 RepID=A0ABU2BXF8_9ACTN|nr:putative membrane protein [Nocardioides marmoribigeumensis]
MSDLGSTRPERGRVRRSERRDEQRRTLRREHRERSEADRQERLDQPKDTRRLRRPRFEDDAFGRFAEQFARFMGTARFLLYMTAFVIAWVAWNWLAPGAFDAYPFIFLTLMLSLQASYAAPLILLAQNRQEDRDRVIAEQDRLDNSRAHADMEFLAREMASLRMALGEVATRDYVRSELRTLLSEIEERLQDDDDLSEGHEPPSEERHTPSP